MSGLGELAQFALIATLCVLLLWAAASDMQRYIIPNRICLSLLFLYPGYALGLSASEIGIAAALAASVLAVGAGLFAFGIMGGGDVKLLAAVSLWAGGDHFLLFLLLTTMAGGFLGLSWGPLLRYFFPAIATAKAANGRPAIPYGVAIAVGGFFVAINLYS
jgi:prepilin peptidase CpaA